MCARLDNSVEIPQNAFLHFQTNNICGPGIKPASSKHIARALGIALQTASQFPDMVLHL